MALIKCAECGRDVSDKAPSCPSCGNPINPVNPAVVQIAQAPGENFHVEPQLTSKTWKQVKLISWGVILLGLILVGSSGGTDPNNPAFSGGILLLFFGGIALVVGKIGAWYADKRTR